MNFGTTIPEDEVARVGLLDRVQLPWRDALAATAEYTFVHNPLTAAYDASKLFLSQADPFVDRRTTDAPAYDSAFGEFEDPKALNEKYSQSLGLTFDKPTRANAVAIMVRRKREEIARNAAMDRAPGGIAYGAASLLTQLAVSATDPLNIASAFIPIVPEARAAIWAAKYGRTGGRALTGVVEGAVGQAALEPLNYGAAKYLGDDYTMGDSLLNIALGGVLGGGLHVGFGFLSDHLSRLAGETREAALRGTLANMADGRAVEVEHIITSDPIYRRFDEMPNVRDLKLAADEARLQAQIDDFTTRLKAMPPGDPRAVDILVRLDAVEQQLAQPDLSPETQRQLSTRRDELLTDTTPERLREQAQPITDRRNLEAQQARVSDELRGVRTQRGEVALQAALTPPAISEAAEKAFRRFRMFSGGERQDPAALLQAQREANTTVTQAANRTGTVALDRARTRTEAYGRGQEPSPVASPEASAAADRIIAEKQGDDLDVELQEATAAIDAYEKQGVLTPQEAEAARAGREGIALAAKQGRAAKAAAICLLLHP